MVREMQVTAALARLLPGLPRLPSLDGKRNLVRDAWQLLQALPGGKVLFSRLLGYMAPYTGSIGAVVVALAPGRAEVEMADRPKVRNHLRSIHAVALVNLAELAGNVALAYSLPDDARFIVSGLEIEYVKKARGPISALGECPVPASSARAGYRVQVTLRDVAGDVVAKCVLHSLVGPKPGEAGGARDPMEVN
jgi:acyl-coenzyme A thioesterase PaaI-like protein